MSRIGEIWRVDDESGADPEPFVYLVIREKPDSWLYTLLTLAESGDTGGTTFDVGMEFFELTGASRMA